MGTIVLSKHRLVLLISEKFSPERKKKKQKTSPRLVKRDNGPLTQSSPYRVLRGYLPQLMFQGTRSAAQKRWKAVKTTVRGQADVICDAAYDKQ